MKARNSKKLKSAYDPHAATKPKKIKGSGQLKQEKADAKIAKQREEIRAAKEKRRQEKAKKVSYLFDYKNIFVFYMLYNDVYIVCMSYSIGNGRGRGEEISQKKNIYRKDRIEKEIGNRTG